MHLGGGLVNADRDEAGLGRTVRGLKVAADGIADYVERVVQRFLADRDAASDETFAQWAHRADEEALRMTTVSLDAPRLAGRSAPPTSSRPSPSRATSSSAASPTTRRRPPRSSRGWPRNFGADAAAVACSMADAALPHLVAEQLPGVDVLFLDTGYHFAETRFTRDEVGRVLDVRIVDVLPEQTVAEQDAEFGAKLHDRDPALCCERRKVAPLKDALGGYEVWFTGVRREEAPTRANTPLVHVGRAQRPREGQPGRRLDLRRPARLRRRAPGAGQPPRLERLPLDRLRAVHEAGRAGRRPPVRPLGRPLEDGMRAARMTSRTLGVSSRSARSTHRPRPHEPTTPAVDLDLLEAEAIHIIREVVAEFERPVLLFSGGKDSVVVLHLADQGLRARPVPFPVLHVDTGHNFPEVLAFRDETVARLGIRLEVARVQDYIDDGRLQERADGTRNPLQTLPLLDAIAAGRHDAVFGGARRDEDKARAKERIISLRDEFGQWDPRNQRPELWSLYNGRHTPGQHVRAFPISNWTELDVWQYIEREGIPLPPLYFAHEREVYARDGMWRPVGEFSPPRATRPSRSGRSATARSAT